MKYIKKKYKNHSLILMGKIKLYFELNIKLIVFTKLYNMKKQLLEICILK